MGLIDLQTNIDGLVEFYDSRDISPETSLYYTATFLFYTFRMLKYTEEEKRDFLHQMLLSQCMKDIDLE